MCLKNKTKVNKEADRLVRTNLQDSGSDGFVNIKQKCKSIKEDVNRALSPCIKYLHLVHTAIFLPIFTTVLILKQKLYICINKQQCKTIHLFIWSKDAKILHPSGIRRRKNYRKGASSHKPVSCVFGGVWFLWLRIYLGIVRWVFPCLWRLKESLHCKRSGQGFDWVANKSIYNFICYSSNLTFSM